MKHQGKTRSRNNIALESHEFIYHIDCWSDKAVIYFFFFTGQHIYLLSKKNITKNNFLEQFFHNPDEVSFV